MRRSWITLGLMLAIVAVLGTWLALRPRDAPRGETPISNIAPDAVRELRVEWPKGDVVVIRRQNGAWRVAAPHDGRADRLQVERTLSLLGARAQMTLPATDLARFELDRPHVRVTIDGQSYALGAANPVTGGVYLLAGDRVMLVESRFGAVVPADAASYNDRQLFGDREAPAAFEFPQFTVSEGSTGWKLAPADGTVSQDDLQRWIDNWKLASALRAEPYAGPLPDMHITVTLRDGRKIPIGVAESDGEIAFTRYDEHMRYAFFAKSARRLLAPPGAAPSENAKPR